MARKNIWHPERIKAELRIRGYTLSFLAGELNVSVTAVSNTIRYANCRSRRIEQAIGDVLGYSPSQIWPDRNRDKASPFIRAA